MRSDNSDSNPMQQSAGSTRLQAEPATATLDTSRLSLHELFEQLGDQARAGDPVAACELAHVVAVCRMHLVAHAWSRNSPPSSASGEELERFVEREAFRQEESARLAQRCEGMNRAHQAEGAIFIARAGLAGHADSLVAFTQLPQTAAAEFIGSPLLIDLYRNQLWSALRRAFVSHHPQVAASVLMQLAGPMESPVAGVVPEIYRDPDVARALLGLMSQGEWDLASMLPPRPPPSVEVTDRAAIWLDELFGGQVPDLVGASQAPWRQGRSDTASSCSEPEAWVDAK
jgi:hypothetical protein